jgi:hypothetical protein
VLLAAGLAMADVTASAAPKAPPPAPAPAAPVRTSDEARSGSVEGAVTAPLRDLNVVKTKIPPVLLQTLTDPYARPPRHWKCAQLAALIRPLNVALGPDVDLVPPGDENLMDRSRSTALGAAADLASDVIPFRGWVRKLSGAEAHDKLVQSAIIAGNVRRAYLKGLGEARGCPPPSTPSHERAGASPAVDQQMPKPKYPTR